jgi:hypothetical protein
LALEGTREMWVVKVSEVRGTERPEGLGGGPVGTESLGLLGVEGVVGGVVGEGEGRDIWRSMNLERES